VFHTNKQKILARQRVLAAAYRKSFSGDQGMQVLMDLMHQFHVLNEHEGKEYHEGQRSVVLYIMKTAGISAERFHELFDEALNGNSIG